jgi:transcriptional regulator with XRE-family HTH domain
MTQISDNSNGNGNGNGNGHRDRNGNGNGNGHTPICRQLAGANGSRRAALILHRLGEVRQQEGVSRRTIAQHLGVTIGEVKRQEDARADLSLSLLFDWQQILNVPLPDLLVPPGDFLSPPVLRQAQMIQLMKLAVTIAEQSGEVPTRRLAQRMVDQLMEIMPELQDVGSLPATGQQRGPDELGRTAERTVPDQDVD